MNRRSQWIPFARLPAAAASLSVHLSICCLLPAIWSALSLHLYLASKRRTLCKSDCELCAVCPTAVDSRMCTCVNFAKTPELSATIGRRRDNSMTRRVSRRAGKRGQLLKLEEKPNALFKRRVARMIRATLRIYPLKGVAFSSVCSYLHSVLFASRDCFQHFGAILELGWPIKRNEMNSFSSERIGESLHKPEL